jgi:AcrR family transcriptional regulator
MALAARRIGAESSATRALILDATELLMREEGYGSVSTRRVAARAGLKPSLVHYYFPTTDDLLLALCRKGADQSDAMMEAALASHDPLRAMWEFFTDTSRTALTMEFMALANHREVIRAEMVAHSELMRSRQVELLTQLLGDRVTAAGGCPPAGLSLILSGIGRVLVMEGGLGVNCGHSEARDFLDQWLERMALEGATPL